MRGQLTEKANVFSFGIVALELINSRANLDLRLEQDTAYLLGWVRLLFHSILYPEEDVTLFSKYTTWLTNWIYTKASMAIVHKKKLMDLLDPAISWTHDAMEEAARVVEMALLCTHLRSSVRLTMTTVVAILT